MLAILYPSGWTVEETTEKAIDAFTEAQHAKREEVPIPGGSNFAQGQTAVDDITAGPCFNGPAFFFQCEQISIPWENTREA